MVLPLFLPQSTQSATEKKECSENQVARLAFVVLHSVNTDLPRPLVSWFVPVLNKVSSLCSSVCSVVRNESRRADRSARGEERGDQAALSPRSTACAFSLRNSSVYSPTTCPETRSPTAPSGW